MSKLAGGHLLPSILFHSLGEKERRGKGEMLGGAFLSPPQRAAATTGSEGGGGGRGPAKGGRPTAVAMSPLRVAWEDEAGGGEAH